jgi:hypothetical protein
MKTINISISIDEEDVSTAFLDFMNQFLTEVHEFICVKDCSDNFDEAVPNNKV